MCVVSMMVTVGRAIDKVLSPASSRATFHGNHRHYVMILTHHAALSLLPQPLLEIGEKNAPEQPLQRLPFRTSILKALISSFFIPDAHPHSSHRQYLELTPHKVIWRHP